VSSLPTVFSCSGKDIDDLKQLSLVSKLSIINHNNNIVAKSNNKNDSNDINESDNTVSFVGKNIVFTGQLQCMPRSKAEDICIALGNHHMIICNYILKLIFLIRYKC
jgi:NAD-dependent DNA ligase